MDYSGPSIDASITTHQETTRDSLKRSRILAAVNREVFGTDDEQAAYFWHPIAVCCSIGTVTYKKEGGDPIEKSVRTLTLEEFNDLPGELWSRWVMELMDSNPHLFAPQEVDNKKK